jgi:hypothetical protein
VLAFDFRAYGASDIPNVEANVNHLDLVEVEDGSRCGKAHDVLHFGPELRRVEAAARQLQVPAFFVGAEDDEPFAEIARSLYDQSPTPDKQLLVLPEGGHGTSLLGIAAVRAALDAFFRARTPDVTSAPQPALAGRPRQKPGPDGGSNRRAVPSSAS